MPDPFIPLPGSRPVAPDSPASFKLKVLSDGETKPVFQPLPLSSPSPPAASPAPAPAPASTPAPAPTAPAKCPPKLTLHRDGSRISRIQIDCPCGQTHELLCDYQSE